jgi:hypothetical protein
MLSISNFLVAIALNQSPMKVQAKCKCYGTSRTLARSGRRGHKFYGRPHRTSERFRVEAVGEENIVILVAEGS